MAKSKEIQQDQGYAVQRRRILSEKSSFYVQEAYRTLRTNITFSVPGDDCKRICLTSTTTKEGKSITSLNLAISFAQAGKKVVLIDADMRRPTQARLLVEKASPGLSNILAGQSDWEKTIRRGIYENLDVIFSGDIPPNPAELLGSPKMVWLLDELSKRYDYIFVDTPPVGVVSDVCVLAEHMDGALFLVWQGKTEKDPLMQSVRQLELAGMKILGFVMNGSGSSGRRYGYRRGYAYSYSYSYAYRRKKPYVDMQNSPTPEDAQDAEK